jgi:cobalamin biosynthesis protein CbiD
VHSTVSRQDFAFLANVAGAMGAENAVLEEILSANTAQEVSEIAFRCRLSDFHNEICRRAWQFAGAMVKGAVAVDVFLMGPNGEIIGQRAP